jgi:hypothetical protein
VDSFSDRSVGEILSDQRRKSVMNLLNDNLEGKI